MAPEGVRVFVTKLCDLAAGTAYPRDPSSWAGFAVTGNGSSGGAATHEVYLNSLGADCGGAERGYISVPNSRVLGVHTRLALIKSLIGP